MMWLVEYSDDAKQDLRDIFEYIRSVLLEPEIAKKQLRRIREATNGLNHMPLRYRLYDREPWRSMGLRVLVVDNFLVLYLPDEDRSLVSIVRVIYGRRDVDAQLG